MGKVLVFFQENWGLVFAILSLIVTIFLGAKGKFNDLLSKTMLFAEKAMARAMEANGKITGQQKKNFVCDYVYEQIPKWMKAFVAREYIAGKIENIITDVKDIEDDGILNYSVKKE